MKALLVTILQLQKGSSDATEWRHDAELALDIGRANSKICFAPPLDPSFERQSEAPGCPLMHLKHFLTHFKHSSKSLFQSWP